MRSREIDLLEVASPSLLWMYDKASGINLFNRKLFQFQTNLETSLMVANIKNSFFVKEQEINVFLVIDVNLLKQWVCVLVVLQNDLP